MSDASNADSLATTTNRLALAAAILAAGAFTVAFAQAMLEYSSSGSERYKCTECAIHISKNMAHRRWSPLAWKWRYYYPELDFSAAAIFAQLIETTQNASIETSFLRELPKIMGRGFRSLASNNVPKRGWLHDGMTVMVTPKENIGRGDSNDPNSIDRGVRAMTTKDLTWLQCFRWYWWLWRNPQQSLRRPRATWAQILRAFGLRSVRKITLRSIDAGTIPEYIDVPIQRIKIFDLGILCFAMGFSSVKIDIELRTFTAIGPFGSLTTENIQNFGKVLRFEGDMIAIHRNLSQGPARWLIEGAAQTNGKLLFGSTLNTGSILPFKLIVDGLIQGWSADEFELKATSALIEEDENILLGHVRREASSYQDILKQSIEEQLNQTKRHTEGTEWPERVQQLREEKPDVYMMSVDHAIANWQHRAQTRVPSLLVAASCASLLCLRIGYPSRALLNPLQEWLRAIALDLAPKNTRPSSYTKSRSLQKQFAMGKLSFVREESRFVMYWGNGIEGDGGSPCISWGVPFVENIFKTLPEDIRNEIMVESSDADTPRTINGLMMPQAIRLLSDFEPRKWVARCELLQTQNGVGTLYRPANLLWTQVVMLDISIRLLIQNTVPHTDDQSEVDGKKPSRSQVETQAMNEILHALNGGSSWTKPELQVLRAIQESSLLDDSPSRTTEDDEVSETPGTSDGHLSNVVEGPSTANPVRAETNHESLGPNATNEEPPITPGIKRSPTALSEMFETPEGGKLGDFTTYPWDLAGAIRKHSGMSTEGPKFEENIQKLSDLLKLRALFFIAFLMVSPDSTDVYLAADCEVEMPMI